MARIGLLARALRRAARYSEIERDFALRRGQSAEAAREMGRREYKNELQNSLMGAGDDYGADFVSLPNRAEMRFDPLGRSPFSPQSVYWEWNEIGLGSALDKGARTRRQVAETMNAAMQEVGNRALRRFPRPYDFAPLTDGHERLYARMARRLRPFYRSAFDDASEYSAHTLTPTAAAYALYGGQQAARGAGLLGIINALTPAQAGEPE